MNFIGIIGKIEINLNSYDLIKYSFVENKIFHLFKSESRKNDLKFSSGVGIAVATVGGSADIENDFDEILEFNTQMIEVGLDIGVAKGIMSQEVGGYRSWI